VLAYWLCQLFGWGLNAFGQIVTGMSRANAAPTWQIALEVLVLNVTALLLSHLLRHFIRHHRWHTLRITALIPRIFAASVALGVPIALLMSFTSIRLLWGGGPEDEAIVGDIAGEPGVWFLRMDLLVRAINWTAIFAFWMGLYFSLTSVRDRHRAELRQSELAHALKVAELRVLKSQLNPHFLFNSLNSVRALIADDPTGAQKAVTQLARTLRYTLTAGQEEVVSLERELDIVDDYLELESLRLGERLHIERTISVEARVAHIPVMMLQTVVENAIKHGIAGDQARHRRVAAGRRVADQRRSARAGTGHRSREPPSSASQPLAVARRRSAQRSRALAIAVRRGRRARPRSVASGFCARAHSHSAGATGSGPMKATP
jgi:two-component system, LytTR family, sensor histidine kinase AlgZ